jgi:DNA gyrase subunit B
MFTVDNGDHLRGFTDGLISAVKTYMTDYKVNFDFKNDDIKEGLVGVVAVRVADPNFEGQAKSKLVMKSVKDAVKGITEDAVHEYLDKNPDVAKAILAKIEQASKARIAAAKAREASRKNKALIEGGTPAKLADCASKDPAECEIYIVEGDSAGGTAKQGRNRKFQAILPIFGKILNVEKQRLLSVIKNEKIGIAVKAIKTGIGEDFDITKCRYHKIIIMSDADVDGLHIKCLWSTAFYRYLRPIIEAGYLYYAVPPLYKLYKNVGKKNEDIRYAYSDEERDKTLAEMGSGTEIQRYKGLGEMNADQIWETTMNPETRRLYQITLEDAEACEQIVSLCMSEETAPRREWIMENAVEADLDV